MFSILGSGFGLYGYLPALVEGCAQRIVLPERYRERFCARSELSRFADDVRWVENEKAALDCAEGSVLALPPINQVEWIPQCLARPGINWLLLEKPLAHTPETAAIVLDSLIRSGKTFRIGYSFRYTAWGQRLIKSLRTPWDGASLSIHWSFLAHHFRHELRNWKRYDSTGGGALRFYGIHLIALLAEIGYRTVSSSRIFGTSADETEKWIAVLSGPFLPECEVVIDSRSAESGFHAAQIYKDDRRRLSSFSVNLADPFSPEDPRCQSADMDPRVPILGNLCRSLWETGGNEYEWYDATIKLWGNIEDISSA